MAGSGYGCEAGDLTRAVYWHHELQIETDPSPRGTLGPEGDRGRQGPGQVFGPSALDEDHGEGVRAESAQWVVPH